jgi:hypothetical protein
MPLSRLRQGRIAIVTDVRRRDAVATRRLSALAAPTKAFSRTAKSCGPDLPTLGSSLAVMICKAMEAIKPGTPREHEAAVKTNRAGNAGLFRRTCSD